MPTKFSVAALFVLLLWAMNAGAAATAPPRAIHIPRVENAPELQQFISEAAPHTDMTRIEGFVQRTPRDGASATLRTEAFVGYDSKNLFVGFRCYETDRTKLRGRLTNRDRIEADDDVVSLMLDTFNDRRRAYVFTVNAQGVQADAIWTEGQETDPSFEAVWSSKAQLTPFGYAALITIPFRSLRFPPTASQHWGITLRRDTPRLSEQTCWPSCSKSVEGWLSQMAELTGAENITPGRNIQITPYAYARSSRSLDLRDSAHPRFTHDFFAPTTGFDSKVILKDSMVLDVTVNPDFSQIESDEPQTTVNQRFENFFPENRPFFIENADYFRTPIKLVFTRRIADPRFGARLTGKTGPWAIGMLFADDEAPGHRVAPDDPLAGKRADVGIARISRNMFGQSNIGFLYTHRAWEGQLNSAGGFDTRIKFNDQWVALGQAVATFTDLPNGSRLSGPGYYVSIARTGRNLNEQLEYRDISPELRADAGYIYRGNVRRIDDTLDYRWWPNGKVTSWGPHLWAASIWGHDGVLQAAILEPRISWSFKGPATVEFYCNAQQETFQPKDFPELSANKTFHEREQGVTFSSSRFSKVDVSASYAWGTRMNFVHAAGKPIALADWTGIQANVKFRPLAPLRIENSYILDRLRDLSGAGIYNDHILRTKWNWQFTRSLSVRSIVQYDATLANPGFTSLTTDKTVGLDFLITYFVHPGTAVYAGYSSHMSNYDPSLTTMPSGLLRTRSRFMNDDRQIFVKLSYLFRF